MQKQELTFLELHQTIEILNDDSFFLRPYYAFLVLKCCKVDYNIIIV